MYHFYKLYGDSDYEKRLTDSFRKEEHSVTTKISDIVTLSPGFFRNELEIGMKVLGADVNISWKDLTALDALVIYPLIDLLYEYAKIEPEGAGIAAEEMKKVLMEVNAADAEDFPERQIELIMETVRNGINDQREI